MKNYKFRINGNRYEVEILEIEGDIAKIEVNGTKYYVEMEPAKTKVPGIKAAPRPKTKQISEPVHAPEAGAGKTLEIKAPLPGVIIQVLVKEGEDVSAGKTLFTLETMKMENAIKAEKPGKVTAVKINPGQSVLQDELLIAMSV